MTTFTIDSDDHIAQTTGDRKPEGDDDFSSLDELSQRAAEWPMARLVHIWNSLPSVTDVKRFTDRQTAVNRIWAALKDGAGKTHSKNQKKSTRSRKPAARTGSKKAQVIRMLQRPNGASVQEIMHATGWQAHTVRGFISRALVHDLHLKVARFKREKGQPAYRLPR
jgi:Protein of unknown function (DUF3489)